MQGGVDVYCMVPGPCPTLFCWNVVRPLRCQAEAFVQPHWRTWLRVLPSLDVVAALTSAAVLQRTCCPAAKNFT